MGIVDAVVAIILVGGFGLGIGWLIKHVDDPPGQGTEAKMLKRHTALTTAAAKASRKGHVGEANVYQEAADSLLAAWNKHEELNKRKGISR